MFRYMENETKNKSDYISLKEATKYCNYSQDYLSLRARQGKLKAVKIGRNWVTKKEWVEQYLKEFNSNYSRREEELLTHLKRKQASLTLIRYHKRERVLDFGFLCLALILVFLSLSFFLLKIERGVSFQNYLSKETLKEMMVSFSSRDFQASLADTFIDYGMWVKEEAKSLAGFGKKKEITEKPLATKTKEGVVIVSSVSEREEIKNKIKKVFSDKVKIEPKDEISGMIIPVFKTKQQQKYLYILVPVRD